MRGNKNRSLDKVIAVRRQVRPAYARIHPQTRVFRPALRQDVLQRAACRPMAPIQ
jgi:hypothetical protein